MTAKRFNVFMNRIGNWIVEDIIEDKYLINIPKFLGFDDEESANVFCDLLNELHDEKQSVIDWIDKKIEEIKPYNSELCRATLLELKEFLE